MCHFVTLVAPTANAEAVRKVMIRHDRDAQPIEGRALGKLLRPGERQYLTARYGCDCGTVLADCSTPDEETEAMQARKLARKGWSSARIARTLADRRKAKTRPTRGQDSLESWARALRDLRVDLGLSHVGLFLHCYSGSVEEEAINAVRIDALRGFSVVEALATMGEDRLMIFGDTPDQRTDSWKPRHAT
ncbi:MAG: hypothetical protein J7521_12205 [Caulobacter sp.]|nr:hypothetical protein [Caulobacter sp.]